MRKKIIILVLALLFIVNLILVFTETNHMIDEKVYEFVMLLKSDTATNFFKLITKLCNYKTILFLNIIIIFYTFYFKKYQLSILTISSLLSIIVNNIIKIIVRRSRPIGISLIDENFYSFPSGHAMISILFYGMIIYLITKNKIRGYKIINTILIIFIILVGISRVYLGVHFITDIIGGYLLSLIMLFSIINIYERKIK